MANHFSALKRARQTVVRTERNKDARTRLRNSIRTLRKSLKDAEKAKLLLPGTVSLIDKAVKKGVIKENTASRFKSRLTKHVAKAATAPAAPAKH
jgi:small subunit ribosomal protein S20